MHIRQRARRTGGEVEERVQEQKKGRELRGQFRKADANVTVASAANIEDPDPHITLSFSIHIFTSHVDLQH